MISIVNVFLSSGKENEVDRVKGYLVEGDKGEWIISDTLAFCVWVFLLFNVRVEVILLS